MPEGGKLIDLEVELVHQTEKAWLIFDGMNNHWIPKSIGQMEWEEGRSYLLTVPEWMAIDKGLLL
jgi:hypothetical protein